MGQSIMSSSGAGSDASEGHSRSTGATSSSATNPPARPAMAESIARPMVTAVQLDQRTMERLAAQVAAKMREGASGGSVPSGSRSSGPSGSGSSGPSASRSSGPSGSAGPSGTRPERSTAPVSSGGQGRLAGGKSGRSWQWLLQT